MAVSVEAQEQELFAAWERISAREREVGRAALFHAERVFLAIWELEAEVNNGGFDQWLRNPASDHAEEAVAGLREIGAARAAAVCDRVFALLPGGRPGTDRDARQQQLEEADAALDADELEDTLGDLEEEFREVEDDLRTRLCAYMRAHRSN